MLSIGKYMLCWAFAPLLQQPFLTLLLALLGVPKGWSLWIASPLPSNFWLGLVNGAREHEVFICSPTQHSLPASPFIQAAEAPDSSSPALAHSQLPSHCSLPSQPLPNALASSGLRVGTTSCCGQSLHASPFLFCSFSLTYTLVGKISLLKSLH